MTRKLTLGLVAAAMLAFAPFAATSARADGTALGGGSSRAQCAALGLYYNNGGGTRSGCVSTPVVRYAPILDANGRTVGAVFTGVQQYDHVFWTNTLRDSGYRGW